MITSKSELRHFLNADKLALGREKQNLFSVIKNYLSPDFIWSFQKTLRKLEYYSNNRSSFFYFLNYLYFKYRFNKLSIKLGFSIPINVFGPGLAIVHRGTIVISQYARIGSNCRLHVCTNIGASNGLKKAPIIGNNVYIAPGAKIYGDIVIGNNIAIGANSVVNKSFTEDNILIAGIPAKKIKSINIEEIHISTL